MNRLPAYAEKKSGIVKRLEPRYTSKIGFSTLEGYYLVCISEILFLRAKGNYTQVNLMNGQRILVSKTLKLIEKQLPENNFKRCHHSYVINLEEVVQLKGSIFLTSGDEIPISRRKRHKFRSWFLNMANFV